MKLIAACISSLTIACTSYASNNAIGNTTSSSTIQKQITALKAQVLTLESKEKSSVDRLGVKPGSKSLTHVLDIDNGKKRLPFALMPSYQYPLMLLKARSDYSNKSLVLGGYIQSETKGSWGKYAEYGSNRFKYTSGYGTYAATARLYFASNINRYMQANLTIEGSQSTNPFFKEAFLTLGNLKSTPFYVTLGKTGMYLGKFSGGSQTINGLTKLLFQPGYEPNLSLGYAKDNLIASVSLFNSGSHKKLNAIYTVSYKNKLGPIKYLGILGYVHSIQGTGMGVSKQYKNSVTGDKVISGRDKNPVINFDGQLGYGSCNISGGYATTAFSRSYTNNKRASAFYVQGSYSTPIFNQKTTFSISYNHAYNTQKFAFRQLVGDMKYYSVTKGSSGIKELYTASAQRAIFSRNVMAGLEYGRMVTYSNTTSNQVAVSLSLYI